MLQALIFDFDGLILDTETPLYESWNRTFERFGLEPIAIEWWANSLGRHGDDPERLDPFHLLQQQVARTLVRDEIKAFHLAIRDEILDALPIQPGVVELLDEAAGRGIPTAVASSSRHEWIVGNLTARGLIDRFSVLASAGGGVLGKPDPGVYLKALRELGAHPGECLALEDSPNGAAAAKAAGLRCVAVPTTVGASLDISHADQILPTLLDLNLTDWD